MENLTNPFQTKCLPAILSLLYGTLLLTCTSCSTKNTPLKSVSFDHVTHEIHLKLSDLLQEPQFIPLETNSEFLLGNVYRVAITEKYLLAIEQTKVSQFSRQGKFIRQLMARGNGPNEFHTVVFPVTVPGSEILYYMDLAKDLKNIHRINLESGEHLPPFNPGSDYYTIHAADSQGYIYGIPNSGMLPPTIANRDTTCIVFKYHPDKKIRHTYSAKQGYKLGMTSASLLMRPAQVTLLNLNYSDTLFSIQNKHLQPLCRLLLKNKSALETNIGSDLTLSFTTQLGYIFLKLDSQFTRNEAGKITGRNIISSEYLYLDKQNNISKIKSIDFMGFKFIPGEANELYTTALPSISGNLGYYILDAPAYKKLYPESTLKEDDNPVILIGKL